MSLFYSTNIQGDIIKLLDDEHKHCILVMRHKVSDYISILDGNGHAFECQITHIDKKETTVSIVSKKNFEAPTIKLCIGITPTKNLARIEWFVEKAVEIGITQIVIYSTKRTERKIHNHDRMHKIMVSAMKQSKHYFLPKILYTNSIVEALEEVDAYEQKYIAHCEDPQQSLDKALDKSKDCVVFIGPEGDFTQEEIKTALHKGFIEVSLGKSRLRTETAGLVALVMMQ